MFMGLLMTLKYGHRGNLKYELKFAKRIVVWFDSNGNPSNFTWSEAEV